MNVFKSKLVYLFLFAFLFISCSKSYDQDKADMYVDMIEDGEDFTDDDYSEMIDLCQTGMQITLEHIEKAVDEALKELKAGGTAEDAYQIINEYESDLDESVVEMQHSAEKIEKTLRRAYNDLEMSDDIAERYEQITDEAEDKYEIIFEKLQDAIAEIEENEEY